MKKLISLSISAVLLAACCQNSTQQPPKNAWTNEEINQKIEEILPQLSLDEKLKLCHAQSKFSVSGVERLGIPELWMSDGPHGVRSEINWDDWGYAQWTQDSVTSFPALTALAASFDPELSRRYGEAIAEEALYRGKDVMLGPGVNIYRTPLCGRNFEYMGEDPFLASKMVVPYVQAMQQKNVAACVKHFALNNQEVWRNLVDVHVSDRALREIYLPAFEAAVKEGGAWSIMGSYNQYNGQYCCHNAKLNNILRNEWGFDGCVITDWGGAMNTKEAAENGLDIEMGTYTNGLTVQTANFAYNDYFLANPYKKMLLDGTVSMQTLDNKVRNVLRLMFRTTMAPHHEHGCKRTPEHFQTALDIAKNGIVLLKNDNNLLPIDKNASIKIAVIGENATRSMKGGGSSELKPFFEISPLEAIKKEFPNAQVTYAMGYGSGPEHYGRVAPSPYNAAQLFEEAEKVAQDADLILFIGGLNKSHQQDCEAGDRVGLELPFEQDKLIERLAAINKNIACIFISGNAVAMPWIDSVPAVMQAWYLGCMGGEAIADVLSGDFNPSGKLPFTFPVKLADNAAHNFNDITSYPSDSANNYYQDYKEGILVGYRWHDTKNIKPLFAFGHGLSYTTFEVADAKASLAGETINVTAQIKNTGSKDGAEVLQVYVGKSDSSVPRALKELKGFQKLQIKAGASATAQISIPVEKLSYWNESTSAWTLEKGEYTLYIGTASDNITTQINIQI